MTTPDWKHLKHAQGPATRVPAQVKKLAGATAESREEAFLQLREALVAPGQWFSASGPAAELLAKQAAGAKAGRDVTLRLLGEMAAGDHNWFVSADAPKLRNAQELSADTLRAATAVIPAATWMLSHAEPESRAAAAFFLGLVPGGDDAAMKIGDLAQRDPSVEVRATATVALGLLSRAGAQGASARLDELALDDALMTAAHWTARVISGVRTTPDEDAAGAAGWFSRRGAATPWCSVGTSGKWISALVSDPSRRGMVAPAIVKSFVAAGDERQNRRRAIGELALDLAGFKTKFAELDVVTADELDDGQRRTAAALMDMPDVVLALRWGLPGSARTIGKWLELSPASPLEELDGGGQRRWQKVRAAIAAKQPFDAVLHAAWDGLAPLAKLEVADELLMGAYKILLHASNKISPATLDELAAAAGGDAVTWAKQLVALGASARRASVDTFYLLDAHLFVAFKVLLRAKVALELDWDDAIGIEPPEDARLVLEAIAPERRAKLLMRKLDRYPPAGQGFLIKKTMPLIDLVGSPELIARFKALMTSPAVIVGADPATAQRLAELP
jgi:hypothetical protein